MIAYLRQSRVNRYTLNVLTGLLDRAGVAWEVADSAPTLAAKLLRAEHRGRGVLALYSFMTPHLEGVRAEVRELRAVAPQARFLAGGAHATADPEGTLALGFDFAFAGEAERSLPRFLAAGAEGDPVLRDPEGGPSSLDDSPAFGRGRTGPVELTRGCRGACAFCAISGLPVRHRSPESTWAAARTVLRSGRRRIGFITPDALSYGSGLDALEALLAGLRGLGADPVLGTFPSEVHPRRVTPEGVRLLGRYCSNRTLVLGAQSGSDAVLRRLRRGHSAEDALRAARTARGGGFLPHVDVIFGLPGESEEDRRATRELILALRRESGARIHAHYFHPLPGTSLWREDPTPLDAGTRGFLTELRSGGAEDGWWAEQERWAWKIVSWAREGVIRTPR